MGIAAGVFANIMVALRFSPPATGSQEDEEALKGLDEYWNTLNIIRTLRAQSYHLHADTPLRGIGKGQGGWVELDIKRNLAESPIDGTDTGRIQRLTQETLSGYRGLGIQRAFWNSETRELVAVVWIGPMLSGWPGVAHGGAIATMFQDSMSRMIAGPHSPIGMSFPAVFFYHRNLTVWCTDVVPSPSSISVDYLRPTFSSNEFILRASFSNPDKPQQEPPTELMPKSWLPSSKDFTKKKTHGVLASTVEITGTLEDLNGNVKVRAKGVWPTSALQHLTNEK